MVVTPFRVHPVADVTVAQPPLLLLHMLYKTHGFLERGSTALTGEMRSSLRDQITTYCGATWNVYRRNEFRAKRRVRPVSFGHPLRFLSENLPKYSTELDYSPENRLFQFLTRQIEKAFASAPLSLMKPWRLAGRGAGGEGEKTELIHHRSHYRPYFFFFEGLVSLRSLLR